MESKYNTKDSHQITREQKSKGRRDLQKQKKRPTKTNPTQ